MPAITFHVLSDSAPDAQLRYACRVVEEAVDAGQRVFVRVQDDTQAQRMDDLLWTFGDRSFLPHEIAQPNSPSHARIRVLIGHDAPANFRDVLINLGDSAPADLSAIERIVEFVPTDENRKRAARVRFKAYRDAGIEPTTQNV